MVPRHNSNSPDGTSPLQVLLNYDKNMHQIIPRSETSRSILNYFVNFLTMISIIQTIQTIHARDVYMKCLFTYTLTFDVTYKNWFDLGMHALHLNV